MGPETTPGLDHHLNVLDSRISEGFMAQAELNDAFSKEQQATADINLRIMKIENYLSLNQTTEAL